VWSSSSEPKRVPDEAATATAKADWEKKKAEAEAKGEAFTEAAPEPVRAPAALRASFGITQRSAAPLAHACIPTAQVMKTEYETAWSWKVQNDNKPIWVRNPKEVEKDSYSEFFKTTFKCVRARVAVLASASATRTLHSLLFVSLRREFMDPLAHNHFSIEGDIEFKARSSCVAGAGAATAIA